MSLASIKVVQRTMENCSFCELSLCALCKQCKKELFPFKSSKKGRDTIYLSFAVNQYNFFYNKQIRSRCITSCCGQMDTQTRLRGSAGFKIICMHVFRIVAWFENKQTWVRYMKLFHSFCYTILRHTTFDK